MKRFKRIAVILVAGFFAFAPPGTLIFGLFLLLAVVKSLWARLALLVAALLTLVWVLARRRRARRSMPDAQ